jgi:diphosphoinositol-polyphosphate diphosphatase
MNYAMTAEALAALAFPSGAAKEDEHIGDVPADGSHPASQLLQQQEQQGPPSVTAVALPAVTACTTDVVVPPPLQQLHGVVPVSSSSSTCTRDSDNNLSDAEGGGGGQIHLSATNSGLTASAANGHVTHPSGIGCVSNHRANGSNDSHESVQEQPQKRSFGGEGAEAPDRWNAKVRLLKTSRQGRMSQRWQSDGQTGEAVRLVTGCVPILRSGKILFISSSRQSEWILPKGGWEQDESMEESAVRECFEEAGVLGSLGPPLAEVQYETRKAKKRRLEQQQHHQQQNKEPKIEENSTATTLSVDSGESGGRMPLPSRPLAEAPRAKSQVLASPHSLSSPAPSTASPDMTESAPATTPHLDLTRIRWLAQQNAPRGAMDETASVASNFSSCTHQTNSNQQQHSQVRMVLFPLYVTDVHDDWPERGRLRTAVDIDQAIAMMDARPEFRLALEEVKTRGLHLAQALPGEIKEQWQAEEVSRQTQDPESTAAVAPPDR